MKNSIGLEAKVEEISQNVEQNDRWKIGDKRLKKISESVKKSNI